ACRWRTGTTTWSSRSSSARATAPTVTTISSGNSSRRRERRPRTRTDRDQWCIPRGRAPPSPWDVPPRTPTEPRVDASRAAGPGIAGTRRMTRRFWVCAALLPACASPTRTPLATATIGAAGGELSATGGPTLVFPPGALAGRPGGVDLRPGRPPRRPHRQGVPVRSGRHHLCQAGHGAVPDRRAAHRRRADGPRRRHRRRERPLCGGGVGARVRRRVRADHALFTLGARNARERRRHPRRSRHLADERADHGERLLDAAHALRIHRDAVGARPGGPA